MSLFGRILNEFKKISLNEKSSLNEAEAVKAMDQLAQLNNQIGPFDR